MATAKKKEKKLTLKQKVTLLRGLLLELHKKKYHHPDSDAHEYCAGCQRSPYWKPAHADDCIVPRFIDALMKTVGVKSDI